MRSFFSLCVLVAVTVPVWAGCGDDDASSAVPSADAGATCAALPAPTKPAAACDVSIYLPLLQANASQHVPEGTVVSYCTNPPSSGPHYPVWADFQEYKTEVPASYLVHSLEHGAVELFYKCTDGCPDVVAGLEAIRNAQPQDPDCAAYNEKSRVIIAPNSAIPTKVAAAAWGAIYTADCLDSASLAQFVTDHYDHGTEHFCNPGRTF